MKQQPLDADTALNVMDGALTGEVAQIVAAGTALAGSGPAEADTTCSTAEDRVSVDVRRSSVEEDSVCMVD
jgi:hypothetical protein